MILAGCVEILVLILHVYVKSGQYKIIQGDQMFESSVSQDKNRGTAEERLWRAVIAKTLEEWVRGPLRYSRIAEEFLFHDNKDFQSVCSSAGMDPRDLRERLHSIRARISQKANGHSRETGSVSSRQRISQTFVRVSS